MTATNFRDLLAAVMGDAVVFGIHPIDLEDADEILAMPVPWVDCPTCVAEGFDPVTENDCGPGLTEYLVCSTCHGTGKATVAQLLAWGSAVADPIDSPGLSGDDDYEAVVWYRNRILDTRP